MRVIVSWPSRACSSQSDHDCESNLVDASFFFLCVRRRTQAGDPVKCIIKHETVNTVLVAALRQAPRWLSLSLCLSFSLSLLWDVLCLQAVCYLDTLPMTRFPGLLQMAFDQPNDQVFREASFVCHATFSRGAPDQSLCLPMLSFVGLQIAICFLQPWIFRTKMSSRLGADHGSKVDYPV